MHTISLNQQFVPADAPSIFANDRGLLLGDGLFETLRACRGKVPFLSKHWKRFTHSAEFLNISVPITLDTLHNHILELLKLNQLEQQDARIRITLTRSGDEAGLSYSENNKTTLVITTEAYEKPKPIHHIIISNIRRNEFSPLANIKSINYLDNILALKEAKEKNADDAILLNTQGNIACATTSNLFIVKNNTIYTPKIEDGVLPGIMRGIVLELANKIDIPCKEISISVDNFKNADEVFLTNSLAGIRSVPSPKNVITPLLQEALTSFIMECF